MQIYDQLAKIFNEFNEQLFDEILGDKIPECLITLQRKANVYSEMNPHNYVEVATNQKMHEIILNPQWFGLKPRIEILQYIAHQMVHVYQHTYGEPAGKGKHDEQFLDYMMAIGLMPSDTGLPDGKSLGGKKILNYPLPDGAFLRVANELAEQGNLINWYELDKPKGFSVDGLVKELYFKKDLLDDSVHASLLHVPLLLSQNIDVDALLDCLELDQDEKDVVIDASKASKLAESAIKANRDLRKDDEYDEDLEWQKSKTANFADHAIFDQPGEAKATSIPNDLDEVDEGFQEGKPPSIYRDEMAGDAADQFLKQAIANKPEAFETHAHPGQQKVVKSTNEIAAVLGLSSTSPDEKKPVNKREFKYTCSCEKTVKGGLGLNLICGHCQLHFVCENTEKEVDVVLN